MHRAVGWRFLRRGVSSYVGEYGAGGRSSVSGLQVALFGATHTGDSAFLARYVASLLGQEGSRLRAANHGCELETRHLKVQFDLGQFAAPFYSPRDAESMAACIGAFPIVVNCVGNYYETGQAVPTRRPPDYSWRSLSTVNYSFEEVHVDAARRLAKTAKESGCETFVHVSSTYADLESPSRWARTRALGELAVREEFPEATIVRAAPMFGHEDRFLNWFATSALYFGGYIPIIEDGQALVQPVFVQDVAKAVVKIIRNSKLGYPDDELYKGKTFELYGPADYSRKELAEFTYDITKQNITLIDTPAFVADLAARAIELLPEPHLTVDDVQLAQIDAVAAHDGAADILSFADLDITPTPIEKIAFSYLHRFRAGGHFILAKGMHND